MRKAVDALLFSGDFTPTTFNLAFFMHSLFREDIDRETKTLKEEKEASVPRVPRRGAAPARGPAAPAAACAGGGRPRWPRPRERPRRRPRRPPRRSRRRR